VPGVSLDVRLRSGALPENEVTRLGYQLAQGLAAEGIWENEVKLSSGRPAGVVELDADPYSSIEGSSYRGSAVIET